MKKSIVFSCIMLFCSVAWAQSLKFIPGSERVIGKNVLTDRDIMAKEYTFAERIYDSHFDTLSGFVTLQLRGSSKNNKSLS